MTTQRPGFVSRNTEDFSNGNANEKIPFDTKDRELDNDASKTGIEVDIQDGQLNQTPSSAEQGEDDFAEKGIPVESAADLVTQIIHLDDDPTEPCLTFRTWFLGMRDWHLRRSDLSNLQS